MKQEIVDDIKRVAANLGLKPGDEFGNPEYQANGARFSPYQISDGGKTWSDYCKKAGFSPRIKKPVSDEEYWERYEKAVKELGRSPKRSELKMFGLALPARRAAILQQFRERAIAGGLIQPSDAADEEWIEQQTDEVDSGSLEKKRALSTEVSRPVPPIPEKTRRKQWERTGIIGFPYAPQDEDGVIAVFAILCAQGVMP